MGQGASGEEGSGREGEQEGGEGRARKRRKPSLDEEAKRQLAEMRRVAREEAMQAYGRALLRKDQASHSMPVAVHSSVEA